MSFLRAIAEAGDPPGTVDPEDPQFQVDSQLCRALLQQTTSFRRQQPRTISILCVPWDSANTLLSSLSGLDQVFEPCVNKLIYDCLKAHEDAQAAEVDGDTEKQMQLESLATNYRRKIIKQIGKIRCIESLPKVAKAFTRDDNLLSGISRRGKQMPNGKKHLFNVGIAVLHDDPVVTKREFVEIMTNYFGITSNCARCLIVDAAAAIRPAVPIPQPAPQTTAQPPFQSAPSITIGGNLDTGGGGFTGAGNVSHGDRDCDKSQQHTHVHFHLPSDNIPVTTMVAPSATLPTRVNEQAGLTHPVAMAVQLATAVPTAVSVAFSHEPGFPLGDPLSFKEKGAELGTSQSKLEKKGVSDNDHHKTVVKDLDKLSDLSVADPDTKERDRTSSVKKDSAEWNATKGDHTGSCMGPSVAKKASEELGIDSSLGVFECLQVTTTSPKGKTMWLGDDFDPIPFDPNNTEIADDSPLDSLGTDFLNLFAGGNNDEILPGISISSEEAETLDNENLTRRAEKGGYDPQNTPHFVRPSDPQYPSISPIDANTAPRADPSVARHGILKFSPIDSEVVVARVVAAPTDEGGEGELRRSARKKKAAVHRSDRFLTLAERADETQD